MNSTLNPPYAVGNGFFAGRIDNQAGNQYPIGINTFTGQKQTYGIPTQSSNLNGIGGG